MRQALTQALDVLDDAEIGEPVATEYRRRSPQWRSLAQARAEVDPSGLDHLQEVLTDAVICQIAAGCAPDPSGYRWASRYLAARLGQTYPGQAIEVRIPPHTAVQLGSFTTETSHHRGTPPNVVEMDADLFIRLSCGFVAWSEVTDGGILFSGAHADELGQMLPHYQPSWMRGES